MYPVAEGDGYTTEPIGDKTHRRRVLPLDPYKGRATRWCLPLFSFHQRVWWDYCYYFNTEGRCFMTSTHEFDAYLDTQWLHA